MAQIRRDVGPQPIPVMRPDAAGRRCAEHLSTYLCQPQQPLHACLSRLYRSDEMAQAEIDRSLAVLRQMEANVETLAKRRGRLTVLLPAQQPLYSLVTQVILPATVCSQVRATTVFGPMQAASQAIFGWLAQSMGGQVTPTPNCSSQLWQSDSLGSIMLAHPDQHSASVRKGLSLTSCPDAVLSSSWTQQAQLLSAQLQGCSVLMPQYFSACAVISDQTEAQLRLTTTSIASGVEQHLYRHGGTFDVLLVQDSIADRVDTMLQQSAAGSLDMPLRWLEPEDRIDRLVHLAASAPRGEHPVMARLRYRHDADLKNFIADLARQPVQLSLYGVSPTTTHVMPAGRLHLGRTPVAAEDLAHTLGLARPTGCCEVRGNQAKIGTFDLLARLQLAIMPPTAGFTSGFVHDGSVLRIS